MTTKLHKLKESLERGEFCHALLLEAHDSSVVELGSLFKRILCQRDQVEACGSCESCRIPLDFTNSERNHPDFWKVAPENENAYSVEQVREWEGRFLYLSKNISPRKLLVIPQAEKLSGTQNAAANALLKILEEPRAGTHLILLSSSPLRLLPTIRSRCLKVNLKSELPASAEIVNENFSEITNALWGRFSKDSDLSNATWWKNKAEKISALENSLPQTWQIATQTLVKVNREEAMAFWTRWKHYEDFLWALRHYGNPGIHWLNFKRKVLTGQPWRTSKLFV